MKPFSVDTGLLTQNLKVSKWHLCFKFSGSHTMSTARIVPFWELALLEPQNLKYGYRKHILPTENGDYLHSQLRMMVRRPLLISFLCYQNIHCIPFLPVLQKG